MSYSNDSDGLSRSGLTKIVIFALAIVALVSSFFLVKIRSVAGNELGVLETWSQGVVNEPYNPGTHFFFPGFNKSLYVYDMGMQVFVMNDKSNSEEHGTGRAVDSYLVQSKEGQDLKISLNLQWSRDPAKIVEIHKTVRDNIEERLIRPVVMRIVKDEATKCSALDAYSGEGLVNLQNVISKRLTDPANELRKGGVIIHNFVIEHIALDAKYVEEIKAKQVAIQERLKNIEQTKAAESAAEKAKATAQADYEKTIVEARRDKEKGILEAEKEAQMKVVQAEASAKKVAFEAEAEKNRNVLTSTGERDAALNRAKAIEALGKAEAEAMRLKLSAYSAAGAEGYVRIEVAKSMATAFQNIKGYLPEKMSVNLLAEQYSKGVSMLTGDGQIAAQTIGNIDTVAPVVTK